MNTPEKILENLSFLPGAIATEVGATPAQMVALESASKVIRVGERKTGKRGRPPVEWAVNDGSVTLEKDTSPVKGAPKLPDPSDVRDLLGEAEQGALNYIERVFAGDYGQRELGDYKLLHGRYSQIINDQRRRMGLRHEVVVVETDDE